MNVIQLDIRSISLRRTFHEQVAPFHDDTVGYSSGFWSLRQPSWAQTRPPIVEQLAKTYGLDSFGQIEAIRYTFNLDLPALKVNLSRTWTWEPKTGQVTYEGKDKDGKPVKVTYIRSQLNSAACQRERRN